MILQYRTGGFHRVFLHKTEVTAPSPQHRPDQTQTWLIRAVIAVWEQLVGPYMELQGACGCSAGHRESAAGHAIPLEKPLSPPVLCL